MKKWSLVFFLLLGCDNSTKDNPYEIVPCGGVRRCAPQPNVIVLKGEDGISAIGAVEDIKSVFVSLKSNNEAYEKAFKGQSAIRVATKLNLAFPKENASEIVDYEVTGYITIIFSSFQNTTETRSFTILNEDILLDNKYPEISYKASSALTVDWLLDAE